MTSVVFFTKPSKNPDVENAGVVKKVGDSDSTPELNVKNDNHKKTFLIRNDDGSVELITILKRSTADLVLPDNRMGSVTIVESHMILKNIPLNTFGLDIVIPTDMNIMDSMKEIQNIIGSLQYDQGYDYVLFDEDYNPISDKRNVILKKGIGSLKSIPDGNTLLKEVKKEELKNDIRDIKKGYICNIPYDKLNTEWLNNIVEITNDKEEERLIDIGSFKQ